MTLVEKKPHFVEKPRFDWILGLSVVLLQDGLKYTEEWQKWQQLIPSKYLHGYFLQPRLITTSIMLTEITSGVRISVDCRFEANLSNPLLNQFIFSYRITIENQNEFPIQLLRRHWFIFDAHPMKREVEGPGVVGEFPMILPNEFYTYSSACDLASMRGTMGGFYTMQRYGTKEVIKVNVPQFKLEVPYGLN